MTDDDVDDPSTWWLPEIFASSLWTGHPEGLRERLFQYVTDANPDQAPETQQSLVIDQPILTCQERLRDLLHRECAAAQRYFRPHGPCPSEEWWLPADELPLPAHHPDLTVDRVFLHLNTSARVYCFKIFISYPGPGPNGRVNGVVYAGKFCRGSKIRPLKDQPAETRDPGSILCLGFWCQFERMNSKTLRPDGYRAPWKNASFFRHHDLDFRRRAPWLYQGLGFFGKFCYDIDLLGEYLRLLEENVLLDYRRHPAPIRALVTFVSAGGA